MKINPYREHLRIGRSQRKRLQTIQDRIMEMADGWDEVDNCLVTDLGRLADEIEKQIQTLDEMILEWREGHD